MTSSSSSGSVCVCGERLGAGPSGGGEEELRRVAVHEAHVARDGGHVERVELAAAALALEQELV